MNSPRTGRTGLRISEICLGAMTSGFQTEGPEASGLPAGELKTHAPAPPSAAAYPHAMLA